ncbi:hypothetical protein LIER_13361 [Lithospermum erythrorhizon]|uniref:Cystatin domain-containing protein n=1 Tax=Lithospermum erythrorhizon TaxID=34254 RepID=A0AAV3PXB0_LITER
MAKTTLLFTTLVLLTIMLYYSFQVSGLGGSIVGGSTKVKNVEKNQQVQELGKYCVEEYNKVQHTMQKHHHLNGGERLSFTEVVEAETQVVSGIKYYLKISAVDTNNGVPNTFDAIVVVKAWKNHKELLNFSPSINQNRNPEML